VNQCFEGDNPGPLGTGGDHAEPCPRIASAKTVHLVVLVFDLEQITRFLRAVAVAKAQQRFTQIRWEEYNESQVINVIYKIMPWKEKPGMAVVDTASQIDIEGAVDIELPRLVQGFLTKCEMGAGPTLRYLELQQEIKESCMATVRDTLAEATKINQEVVKVTGNSIKILAGIKATSTIVLKVVGLFAPAAGQVIDIGYDVTTEVIKEWGKGDEANVVVITTGKELVKAKLENLGKDLGGYYESKKIVEGEKFVEQMKRTEEMIAKHEKKVEAAIREEVSRLEQGKKVGRRIRDTIRGNFQKVLENKKALANLEEQAVKSAKLGKIGKKAGKGVSVLFAAQDIKEAVGEFMDTWKASD